MYTLIHSRGLTFIEGRLYNPTSLSSFPDYRINSISFIDVSVSKVNIIFHTCTPLTFYYVEKRCRRLIRDRNNPV